MPEDTFSGELNSERVNVGQSAVRQLNASVAQVDQSAVQRLAADSVTASNSAFGVVHGATVELKESAVGVAAADYIRVEDSSVLFLLAPRVSGNVKALLTPPAAFALGAGFILARTLVSLLRKRGG